MLYLDSNDYPDKFGTFEWLLLAGSKALIEGNEVSGFWELLKEKASQNTRPILPGFLSYELKNEMDELSSFSRDYTGFPPMGFFEPDCIIGKYRDGSEINYNLDADVRELNETGPVWVPPIVEGDAFSGGTEAYFKAFSRVQKTIQRGDIYEMNLCRHFSLNVPELDPIALFRKLNDANPAPFSALLKFNDCWLMCSSPERFLNKNGNRLISQPIKGTCRRTGVFEIDDAEVEKMRSSRKERSENIMIADLVRNDLSRYAAPGSVEVLELCGVYEFPAVFHMITTVKAMLDNPEHGLDALAAAFPMGSMTGVPKLKALQIADETEGFARGIYSGAVGYLTEEGNFDFNVVIRSFTWNAATGYLSISSGSAVTALANAGDEARECLLKAEALFRILQG